MNLSNRVRFIIAPTPRAPLIRRNEHGRQQQLVGNLSAGISRWNCINLSSRNGALSFFRYRAGSISRGGPRCFTLLSITSISFRTPKNSKRRAIWPNTIRETERERREGRPMGMAATFMPLSTFRSASPVSPCSSFAY